MFGIQNAFVSVLAQGTWSKPAKAVDELVATVEELEIRRQGLIKEELHTTPTVPCSRGTRRATSTGGTPSSPGLAAVLPSFPSNLRKQLRGCL